MEGTKRGRLKESGLLVDTTKERKLPKSSCPARCSREKGLGLRANWKEVALKIGRDGGGNSKINIEGRGPCYESSIMLEDINTGMGLWVVSDERNTRLRRRKTVSPRSGFRIR